MLILLFYKVKLLLLFTPVYISLTLTLSDDALFTQIKTLEKNFCRHLIPLGYHLVDYDQA